MEKTGGAGGGQPPPPPSACIPRLIPTGRRSAFRVANEGIGGDEALVFNTTWNARRFADEDIVGLQKRSLSRNCRLLRIVTLIAATVILQCKQPDQRLVSANHNPTPDNFRTRASVAGRRSGCAGCIDASPPLTAGFAECKDVPAYLTGF
jgi:hypothetical protein